MIGRVLVPQKKKIHFLKYLDAETNRIQQKELES